MVVVPSALVPKDLVSTACTKMIVHCTWVELMIDDQTLIDLRTARTPRNHTGEIALMCNE